jgi:molybdate transport system substrate-binding protein
MRKFIRKIVGPALAVMLPAANAQPADIRVFSGGAPRAAIQQLAPEFERANGNRLNLTFQLVTEIQRKLAAGEKADVILLPVPLLAATEKIIPLRTEGRVVLARVGIGLIVRGDATPPDISTGESVRAMLLNARAIAVSEPSTPVGGHVDRVIAQLGIADAVRPKLVIKAAIDGGADLVATGAADFGLYLVSEVQAAKGVTLVGLLPAPFQRFVVYGAAVPADSAAPEAALAFVKFISDPAKAALWKAAGFERVGER